MPTPEAQARESIDAQLAANLDIFWLKDEALEESANLPAPGIIADLEAALEQSPPSKKT